MDLSFRAQSCCRAEYILVSFGPIQERSASFDPTNDPTGQIPSGEPRDGDILRLELYAIVAIREVFTDTRE
jgi:hypothetical protein